MNIADQIRDLIAEGNLEDALKEATNFLRARDAILYNECLQHQGRLNDYSRQYRLKVINVETMDLTRAQVQQALVEVVLKRIVEFLGKATIQEPQPSPPQTVRLNFAPTQPTEAPAAASSSAVHASHEAARLLVEAFMKILATYEVENAAWRVAPYLHRSLLQGEMMQQQFKQNNFYNAHQRFRQYKMPVTFTKVQHTNRTAIGGLRDRDEGEEYVYTLEKNADNGGMPGTVRVFFPKNGSDPKITLISL